MPGNSSIALGRTETRRRWPRLSVGSPRRATCFEADRRRPLTAGAQWNGSRARSPRACWATSSSMAGWFVIGRTVAGLHRAPPAAALPKKGCRPPGGRSFAVGGVPGECAGRGKTWYLSVLQRGAFVMPRNTGGARPRLCRCGAGVGASPFPSPGGRVSLLISSFISGRGAITCPYSRLGERPR